MARPMKREGDFLPLDIAEDLSLPNRKLSELKILDEHSFSGVLKLVPPPRRSEVHELLRRSHERLSLDGGAASAMSSRR